MPAVSKKQQRYFGYLLSNPEERKKKGISKKAAKDFAQDIQEVSPPGWGHTKAEKEKTKPWKPKSKIGGTAAAFKRALDDGRFKGLPGSKTKKEKTADMFKLMWAMKKKGDKPHYKPGTDKKYKKYQEEDWKPEIEVVDTKKRKKEAEKKRKEAASSLPPHLRLDAMKKAFAHTNEETVKEGSSIRYVGKKGQYHGPTGDHRRDKEGNIVASHYKKKPAPVGEKYGDKSMRPKTPKPADVRKRTKKGETTRSALNRAKKYEREKVRVYQGDAKRKAAKTGEYAKGYNEELSPMQDNNLFGNAYAGSYKQLKKKIGSKKKHTKPAVEEGRVDATYSQGQVSYSDFYNRAKEARKAMATKSAKRIEYDKKNEAVRADTKKHGIKFSDKKGTGRIVKGKKHYD